MQTFSAKKLNGYYINSNQMKREINNTNIKHSWDIWINIKRVDFIAKNGW